MSSRPQADILRANEPQPYWSPYVAGVALGLVLLASFLIMGFGLGSSAAPTRIAVAAAHLVAPAAIESNGYLGTYVANGSNPFEAWMIFEVIGLFLGGLLGAYTAGRLERPKFDRGPNIGAGARIAFAISGGIIMGFAARLARGCTSGQALTGGALLSVGSWIFMFAVFAGGYALAPLVRRQWR